MTDEEILPHAERLCRYARRLTGPLGALSPVLFVEEVEHSATWYELVNRFDASKFIELRDQLSFPEDYPNVTHGLTRWVLQPRLADDLETLDALAFHVITRCCGFDTIAIRRSAKRDRVKYRFLIHADSHAHCGVITFAGDAVERMQAKAKAAKEKRY